MWVIVYKKSVKKDLKKIPQGDQFAIKKCIEEKIMKDPSLGTPLRKNLKGLWKWRVGGYRIIYSIKKAIITVLLLKLDIEKKYTNINTIYQKNK